MLHLHLQLLQQKLLRMNQKCRDRSATLACTTKYKLTSRLAWNSETQRLQQRLVMDHLMQPTLPMLNRLKKRAMRLLRANQKCRIRSAVLVTSTCPQNCPSRLCWQSHILPQLHHLVYRSLRFWVTPHTHTHTHPFNGPFSGTTQVGRYQKGKTNLDFTEARDSEWQWHQLGHMQVCTSLQTDNHASTPPLSFLQAGCQSCHPTNSVKALKDFFIYCKTYINVCCRETREGTSCKGSPAGSSTKESKKTKR